MGRRFKIYTQNLSICSKDGADYIQSYDTLVAKIDYDNKVAKVLGYWSKTTTKHINYACNELKLKQIFE
jgi:hypothetical protein